MKMNKILAAGVAATLAVSSMAAVASAEEVTFDMGQTKGTIKLSQSGGVELSGYTTTSGDNKYLGIAADDMIIVKVNPGDADKVTGVSLTVTGIKGDRNSSSKPYTYKFTNYNDAACTSQNYQNEGLYWGLKAYAATAPVDSFVPGQFVEITKVTVDVTGETTVYTAKDYDAWGNSTWGSYNGATLTMVQAFTTGADAANPTGLAVTNEINNAVNGMWGFAYAKEKSTTVDYPFMGVTDADGNKTLTRQEIGLLSYAGAWVAENGGNNGGVDGDQTYDDNGFGTNPKDFAGLASQVGDFFNKQTNGTITFKFTTAAASTGTSWQTGGVPSTQVGIKNALGNATANDFVLFFNYDQTGSLQAVTSIDANAGTITFDIADVLDALDGKTIGVIDNIWYGMTKGVDYGNQQVGLKVESITLAYDEDAADDTDIEEDDDDATIEDDDDDADVEDDDDDATVEDDDDDYVDEDDDDDAAEVDGDNDMVDEADDDDDANPGTGVALAVVPALVAAAAVVVSKKRK